MGNVYCVISICAYEEHVKAVKSFCSRDWLWLSGLLRFRASLGTLCLVSGKENSQNDKDVPKDAIKWPVKGEQECL